MRLFIPELGSKMILQSSWSFDLYNESRNEALIDATGETRCPDWRHPPHVPTAMGWVKEDDYGYFHKRFSLPVGTELTIDRIYIRKGLKEFSSVSFFIKRSSICHTFSKFAHNIYSGKGKCRFWAKLADVNTMDIVLRD